MSAADVYPIQGREVTLPCIVRDASSGNAMFMVPAEAAQKLIPGDAFEVMEVAPGQAQLILGIIDYRDNDLGDYNEMAIIFLVKPKGAEADAAGTFIYKLPVDQAFTCEAGCTIWGFPKSVEQIDMTYTDTTVSGRLEMDGQHVFTLTVPRGKADASAGDETHTPTYTYIGGVPHQTAFSTGGANALNPGGEGVAVALGTHPIAAELRSLGLEGARPILSVWNEHMNGSFGPARKLE
jgi:hypothetical protein